MRHASITTMMSVYGRAMPSIKREANSKVVSMVSKKEKREPIGAAPVATFLLTGFLGVCGLPQIPAKLMISLVAGDRFVPNANIHKLVIPFRFPLLRAA